MQTVPLIPTALVFRMALLSGEVEITKLVDFNPTSRDQFRMALLSGEVETCHPGPGAIPARLFRMALLSGEVETLIAKDLTVVPSTVPDGFAIRGS